MIRTFGRWSLLFFFLFTGMSAARDRTVLILPLQFLAGSADQAYLARSIPDSLATSLRNIGGFKVLPVPAAGTDYGYQQALALAVRTNADIVITGSIAIIGSTVDIGVEAIDAATGRIRVTEGARGPAGIELFDLVDSLCSSMSKKMAAELPPLQEYVVTKEVTKVEEIYVNDLKKNHKFLLGFGPSLGLGQGTRPDGISGSTFAGSGYMILGYGYKWFRIGMAGCPPVIQIGPDNALNSGWVYLTFDFDRIPIIVGASFHFVYYSAVYYDAVYYGQQLSDGLMLSPLLSVMAGVRIGKALRVILSVGYSLSQMPIYYGMGMYPVKFRVPPMSLDVEWTIYREFGLALRTTYANITTDIGHNRN